MNFSLGIMAMFFITSVLSTPKNWTSPNWAGLEINALTNENFNSVTGTFSVPLARAPKGATPGNYSGMVWTGINDAASLLQAGFEFDLVLQSDGSETIYYYGWYEWYPLGSTPIPVSDFSMIPGDEIKVDIFLRSSSTGLVTLTNLQTSQEWNQTVTAPDSAIPVNLMAKNAEWIVEDFEITTGDPIHPMTLAPLANFGTINITNCRASTQKSDMNLTDPTMSIVTLVNGSGQNLSSTTVLNDTAAQVIYIGE